MKNTARLLGSWLFTACVLLGLIGLFSAAPSNLFAQAADAAASTGAVVSAPWWSGPEIISAFIALVTGVIAVWSHKEKKTAQKISESLIVGIEAASKIPAVAEKEKAIKAKIRETAEDYGVQPILARLVKDIT